MSVAPDEIKNGSLRKIHLEKSVICDPCNGLGRKEEASLKACGKCQGKGVLIETLLPLFIIGFFVKVFEKTHSTSAQVSLCPECLGEGKVLKNPEDRCKNCNGKATVRERKILELQIEKDMQDGQQIVLKNEGDQDPDLEPGDIIMVLKVN